MKKKPKEAPSAPRKKFLKRSIIPVLLLAVFIAIVYKFYNSQTSQTRVATENPLRMAAGEADLPAAFVAQGRAASAKYCQSCHMLPDPALLDKSSWANVLPIMGQKMGIRSHKGVVYQPYDRDVLPGEAKLQPAMDEDQWEEILDYYIAASPYILTPPGKAAIKSDLSSFLVLKAPDAMSGKRFMVSYVKIDNSVKPARVFVFEAYSQRLYLLDNRLKIIDSVKVDGIIVDISIRKDEILALTMGDKLNMLDSEKIGRVFPLSISGGGKISVGPPAFNSLATPVKIIPADLNGDKLTDYLVCEFGFLTGALTWRENLGGGKFRRHVIREMPGSVNAYVQDKKNDGNPDLWVLFAQGDEGIIHFTNKGKGKWEARQVLRFPPVYGSTSFEMADMNNDGFDDIIYTCGDNADYSLVYKPYHGVYIYMNDGRNNFSQKYFYPINGCYKVIVKDFQNTGRKDLAIIAFFTDPMQPEESFLYLKNEGELNFTPRALAAQERLESILTMDSGDLDGDGRTDLVLGNAFPHPGRDEKGRSEPFFIVLKNKGR